MEQSNTLLVDDLRHCEFFNCKCSVFISLSFRDIAGELRTGNGSLSEIEDSFQFDLSDYCYSEYVHNRQRGLY